MQWVWEHKCLFDRAISFPLIKYAEVGLLYCMWFYPLSSFQVILYCEYNTLQFYLQQIKILFFIFWPTYDGVSPCGFHCSSLMLVTVVTNRLMYLNASPPERTALKGSKRRCKLYGGSLSLWMGFEVSKASSRPSISPHTHTLPTDPI